MKLAILFGFSIAFIVFLVVLDFLQKLMDIESWEEKND